MCELFLISCSQSTVSQAVVYSVYGITSVQTYMYFSKPNAKDGTILRVLVRYALHAENREY